MQDVFGKPLLRLFKEHNHKVMIAAKNKHHAEEILLTNTNFYASVDNMLLSTVKSCGYAGVTGKIL